MKHPRAILSAAAVPTLSLLASPGPQQEHHAADLPDLEASIGYPSGLQVPDDRTPLVQAYLDGSPPTQGGPRSTHHPLNPHALRTDKLDAAFKRSACRAAAGIPCCKIIDAGTRRAPPASQIAAPHAPLQTHPPPHLHTTPQRPAADTRPRPSPPPPPLGRAASRPRPPPPTHPPRRWHRSAGQAPGMRSLRCARRPGW